MSGYIYCFSNDQIKDVYKIGRTSRDPLTRLNEANSCGTWDIIQVTYKFEFAKKVNDCCFMERNIHDILETFNTRVYPNREFFKLSLTTIKKIFDISDGEWYIPEKSVEDNDNNNIEKLDDTQILTSKNNNSTIDESAITCEKCSKIYSATSSYNRHINLGRCKVKINEMVCNYCDKSFKSKQGRQKHEINCKGVRDIEIKKLNEKIKELETITK